MKHKNFTTRAELLRAAADSIEMQEKAAPNLILVMKYRGIEHGITPFVLGYNIEDYEFPLAVVEGKPVWDGDELWHCETGMKFVAHPAFTSCYERSSWNPPKPKTVMVELPIDVLECWSKYEAMPTLAQACRKALEEMK